MIYTRQPVIHFNHRRGTVLPLLAVTLVALISFVALAVDLGMITIAKAQAQNAADLATLTAARTLSGDPTSSYNQSTATTNAQNILSYNNILGQAIQSSQLQLSYGTYDYNQTTQTFNANFPPTNGMPLTAVSATVTSTNAAAAFSTIFGVQFLPNVTAVAKAVHRPRDIALVMDLSGSMRMGTCLGFDFYLPYRASSNNPDPSYPTFGHYSSGSAGMQGSTSNQTSGDDSYTISPSNTTVGNSSYTLTYANNFYQSAAYAGTLIRAFDSYTSTDGGNTWTAPGSGSPVLPPSSYTSVPGGDVPLFKKASTTTYATDVKDVINSTTTNALWELDGYSAYSGGTLDTSGTGNVPTVWTQEDYSNPVCQFNGYTQGPGYYGKTFFLWPPDPRNGAITTAATLKSYLTLIGLTNTTDQSTLAANWSSWSLTQLQTWLQGGSVGSATPPQGGPYTLTSPFVTGSNNKAPLYYAVCRLYNRAYPAGSSNGAFRADWRVRFFDTNNNNTLFSSSSSTYGPAGSLNVPGSYSINYSAILSWLAQSPNPFPQQMRAGRVKYYGSIPTQITGSWPSYGSTDQRFWKEYIDYALGFRQTGASTYQDISAMTGYGVDFTWGTTSLNSPPSAPKYMSYTDNPARPKLRYWFGALTMTDYLQNFNMWVNTPSYYVMQPGDSYEAPVYTAKQAYLASISTMKTNHPNDWFSVIAYSWPRSSASGSAGGSSFGLGRFNCVRSPLGPNYNYAQASLLFPFSTINADGSANNTEATPYDSDPATSQIPSANFVDTPRADGETCFAMALMLAYNQFATTVPSDATLRSFVTSSPIAFPSGMAGGMGRKGAQKVVIFETDGMANTTATATLVPSGSYKYYQIRYDMNKPNSSEFPSVSTYSDINDTAVVTQINTLVGQLATDYGTSRNPFRLYGVGFGPVFQGPNASSATQTLQSMQTAAGTQGSPSIITGTDAQMSANMNTTFTNILQSGVQIALIQ